jgi:hypothetical protein
MLPILNSIPPLKNKKPLQNNFNPLKYHTRKMDD